MKIYLWLVGMIISLGSSSALSAQKLYLQVPVYTILIQEGSYTGCAAKTNIDTFAADGLVGCTDLWVGLDCDGGNGSKSVGASKLGTAQLAYVARRKLNLVVTDTYKQNGFCWASRVDSAP